MKKRPLCIATICYIIGIIMGLYLKISIVFLICVNVGAILLFYTLSHKKSVIIFCLTVLIGFFSVRIVDINYMLQYQLFHSEEEYKIEAIVVSDATDKEYKKVYQIEILKINGNSESKKGKWLLNVKKTKNNKIGMEDDIQFGDVISFSGTVEIPSVARNYMGFDYQNYLKSQKIYGTITAKGQIEVVKHNQLKGIEKLWHDIRHDMKDRLYRLLPQDVRELCIGILIGERQDISEEIVNYFRESNLTHMLAVSGAHISYIVLGLTIILNKTRYPFRKIFIILFLLFFMGLTNSTPSVQRASLMIILVLVAGLLYRRADIYINLSVSSLIILICNPYVITNIGFQLSYAGTLGIVLFYDKMAKVIKKKLIPKLDKEENNSNKNIITVSLFYKIVYYVLDAICMTISANLMIIPIMAFQFNTISFTFWISNLLAGPLLGVIIILGFVLYFISLFSMTVARIISIPLKYFLYLLIIIARFCSQIPFSSIMIRTPFVFEMFSYYSILFIFYFFSYFKKRIWKFIVPILILLFLCYGVNEIINYGKLQIYFVDVGQGDCTLIRTPTNKIILIDGGGSETGTFNVGEKTLLPYLLDRKITKIDYMLISHFDTDHVGGLLYLLEKIEVRNVIISKQGKICENYKKFKELALQKKISIIVVKQGDRLQIDRNIYFDILFPESHLISENILNNNSIVAKLNYGNFSCIFTGDIEEVAERKLVEKYKNTDVLKATALKVAHHGSKSSSVQEILNLVNPEVALIGVGDKNTFGHPNSGVLERLEKLRAKVYRTDLCGEIMIIVHKNAIKISCKM